MKASKSTDVQQTTPVPSAAVSQHAAATLVCPRLPASAAARWKASQRRPARPPARGDAKFGLVGKTIPTRCRRVYRNENEAVASGHPREVRLEIGPPPRKPPPMYLPIPTTTTSVYSRTDVDIIHTVEKVCKSIATAVRLVEFGILGHRRRTIVRSILAELRHRMTQQCCARGTSNTHTHTHWPSLDGCHNSLRLDLIVCVQTQSKRGSCSPRNGRSCCTSLLFLLAQFPFTRHAVRP